VTIRKTKGFMLDAGDVVRVEAGGGGGWGDPATRAVASVQRDLDRGYITRETAERDYAVTVSAEGRVSR
jgi:N-methylhydantoinase B